jgi:hypothetical protein
LGTLFFNAVHRGPTGLSNQPTSRRRWIFVVSFILQTIFLAAAAIIITLQLVSTEPFIAGNFSSGSTPGHEYGSPNFLDLCPIALLAFQAAGQVCLSRVLSLIELPTIVVSTLYHDFTADIYGVKEAWSQSTSLKNFVLVQWRRQEKRLASIIALFVGAIVGSEVYKSDAGMAGALWLAVALKGSICFMFAFWRKNVRDDAPTLPR